MRPPTQRHDLVHRLSLPKETYGTAVCRPTVGGTCVAARHIATTWIRGNRGQQPGTRKDTQGCLDAWAH